MKKKSIVFAYPNMMLGGSTTSLIALMSALDKTKYDIYLQLYTNNGELIDYIPDGVTLLPPAAKYQGLFGKFIKIVKLVFSGLMHKALIVNRRHGKHGMSDQIIADFIARYMSECPNMTFDYAIGFLEGWANRYVVYTVNATNKYVWLHSTFANLAEYPDVEVEHLKQADKIVCVSDPCSDDLKSLFPELQEQVLTIENMIDSAFVRKRAEEVPKENAYYEAWKNSDVFKIITICRLDIQTKGLDRVVKCAEKLKSDGYEFCWCILGDGTQMSQLRQMIKDANLEDCFILTGLQLNPFPFLKLANVYCMPSRYEGKPMTVTEAKILGVVPIVTEYLSAKDQVESGVNGIVVENGDTTIIEPLKTLIDNRKVLDDMHRYLMDHDYGNANYISKIEETLLGENK